MIEGLNFLLLNNVDEATSVSWIPVVTGILLIILSIFMFKNLRK